jgi:hypothetical protein
MDPAAFGGRFFLMALIIILVLALWLKAELPDYIA